MGFVGRSTPLSLVVPPKFGERKREPYFKTGSPHHHNHHRWAQLLLRANALHTHWQPTTSCTSPTYIASYSNGVNNGSISCQICLGEPFSRCKSLCSAADHTMLGHNTCAENLGMVEPSRICRSCLHITCGLVGLRQGCFQLLQNFFIPFGIVPTWTFLGQNYPPQSAKGSASRILTPPWKAP